MTKREDIRQVLRTKPAKRVMVVVAAAVVLVFAWAVNPPVGTVHDFTEKSDYRSERESGCVNSGEGCHGSEKSYKDFNAYHPDSECTACHDYQGIGCIPCHSPNKNHECATCHDGSMKKAQDRVRITDPYPRGHYRESTHTALGTNMERVTRAASRGKAQAKCSDCHSRDLRESHTGVPVAAGSRYGADIGCGECHNDLRSFGLAEVLEKWKGRRCEDCHKTGSSAPMHGAAVAGSVEATGSQGCGRTGPGCHETNDLHATHPDEPRSCAGSATAGEPGCHDLAVESHAPTATACGGADDGACHHGYVNDAYSHQRDRKVHSPKGDGPASDTSFHGTACGGCHWMAPNGTSLVDEHDLPTSERSDFPSDGCRNCHTNPASVDAVLDDWAARDTAEACSACHGVADLPRAHASTLGPAHGSMPGSEGCARSGPGCHPTADLMQVGVPTPFANLHSTCLRCHDKSGSGGNMRYTPGLVTCGPGRDCHAADRSYDPSSGVHAGTGGPANGWDAAHHTAGRRQGGAINVDPASGVATMCDTCHDMRLSIEHARPSASLATGSGDLCRRCHNRDNGPAAVVKTSWPAKASESACAACHGGKAAPAIHGGIDAAHLGIELDPAGNPVSGACSASGCHATADLRRVHRRSGCTLPDCHRPEGDISGTMRACGGIDPMLGCHTGYSAANHFVDHAADLEGLAGGVLYSVGRNVGCFGCHPTDLVDVHSPALIAGSMEGGGASSCAVCHENPDDPGAGAFASSDAVRSAIADGSRRCADCHRSGSAVDDGAAVASAHKAVSSATTLPVGRVWADPFAEWREAFLASTGGGHNALPAGLVGAATGKSFPIDAFVVEGVTYRWRLPANSGATAWLRTSLYPSATTSSGIAAIMVTCADCHAGTSAMAGPHGAAVTVTIDPAYSQTEYANPTVSAFQFEATGTERVVCFKCHQMQASRTPLVRPGGNRVHAVHSEHTAMYPSTSPRHFGEKCIDCHVRIPHAWKRPRLLVRTVTTTDGAEVDDYPYVRRGHAGLAGIRLKSFTGPFDIEPADCANGGCIGSHSRTWHPRPSDVPTASYWP